MTSATHTLLLACARGIPPLLQTELTALGFPVRAVLESGVETEGTLADAMRLNLLLRTANRVLLELARFTALRPDVLYERVHAMPWEDIIPADGYFTVTSFIQTEAIRDSRFANVKCKDAIVDRIRLRCGRRPDSGAERNRVVIFLYWNRDDVKVYLDTSGESLSRRGYRKIPMKAPMQETLAAAVVLATGWDGTNHFVNPMCGSGTLAIEAALLAQGRPPGLLRHEFGFMHVKGFDADAWRQCRTAVRAMPKRVCTGRIVASDIDATAVAAARQNARTAGVEQCIEFHVCDFAQTPVPPGGGVVLLNPEYGERMGDDAALEPVYHGIGDFFKQSCKGYTGYVFTGNLELGKRIGLRSSRRMLFFNSQIECRLLGFQLYEGSKRKARNDLAGDSAPSPAGPESARPVPPLR